MKRKVIRTVEYHLTAKEVRKAIALYVDGRASSTFPHEATN